MTLPVLDQPTYELTLPSTSKKIRYRPFLVKEEKILLMAQEGGDLGEQIESVKQIIRNCIITKDVKIEKLSTFDIEYIFVKIRSKSVGQNIELQYRRDDCKEVLVEDNNPPPRTCQIDFIVNLDEVYIDKVDTHTNKIQLTDNIGIFMKYPDFKMLHKISTMNNYEEMIEVIGDCIETIYMNEELYDPKEYTNEELNNFLESFSQEQFQRVSNFFDTMPQTAYDAQMVCRKCGWRNELKLRGITDFFV